MSEENKQKYAFWVNSNEYEALFPYDNGDLNFEITEDQADHLIEKIEGAVGRGSE